MPIATTNPATGETLRTFDPLTDTELDDKIAHAAKTFQTYSAAPAAHTRSFALCAI
jgi:succinate-semialdehyde dehydrogenase/glutarate-semialdehyde dehydrogenase